VHRRSLWVAAALLVLGIGIAAALSVWVTADASKELCADGDVTPCDDDVYTTTMARNAAESVISGGGSALLLVACLIGVFVAGPLIARELESGTFRMAWAQSVSPARWLAAWLAVPVGALCALLIRRMLLSMAVTTVVLAVVMAGFGRRRWMLWPADRLIGGGFPGNDPWMTEMGMLTASGEKLFRENCPSSYQEPGAVDCLTAQGGVSDFTDYHPIGHFWQLQLVETGILLALAALAVFAAFRVLRRLHG